MKTTTLRLVTAAFAAASIGLPASAAMAQGTPTCSGVFGSDLQVHGQHVIGDYVTGLGGIGGGLDWPPSGLVGATIGGNGGAVVPGGPGPGFHFTIDGLAPGASFCVDQAHPNGFNTPDNVPVPGNR